MKMLLRRLLLAGLAGVWATCNGADVVPNEIMMPGTQPQEVGNFESPNKCDNCHAGYNVDDPGAEPATGWRGAAMGNAGRDPVFWATLAVAEQDFDGAGDLCIRCHSAAGWYGGRSTPTDGSGLQAADDNGIDCDTCHASTNTDNSEHLGVMNSPFIANCSDDPLAPLGTCQSSTEGYYGSGMLSLFPSVNVKMGPYGDADARHQWEQSAWHRHPDFCGTCHDVSNSAVGDLAPNHGRQSAAPDVAASGDGADCVDENGNNFNGVIDLENGKADLRPLGGGCLGGNIEAKAAFNNPPYAYGVVERTFSEYKSSPLWETLVSDFGTLPDDLRVTGGSLQVTYQAALLAGNNGDYVDGTPRYFSCQSCHMRPTIGPGCNKKNVQIRQDLPRHDHTGGNYWFATMSQYQDAVGTLRMGAGLNDTQRLAMDLGQDRAVAHLRQAGNLSIINGGNILKVTNLTGHKLITGYPEGRRMWLNIKWYDLGGNLLREDGAYGGIGVNVNNENGNPVEVESILDLNGTNTRIYEAHYAISREWAPIVQALHGPDFALSYDRVSGEPDCTVSEFLASDPNVEGHCSGSYHDTFHFALNDYVSSDNRIPPYQMSYDKAKTRNALPVPADQYGNPGAGGVYEHWDELDLNAMKPTGAVSATIDLLYQGTSWEYMQFLQLANKGTDPLQGGNAFLGNQGDAMMAAWINGKVMKSDGVTPIEHVMQVNGDYRMVPPVVMDSTEWGTPPVCTPSEDPEVSCSDGVDNDCDGLTDAADPDCDTPPVCTYNDPSVTVSPNAQDITIDGGSVDYTVTVTNNDTATCPATTFGLSVNDSDTGTNFVVPSALGQNSVLLTPGANADVTLTVTAQSGAPNGAANDTSVATAADANHGAVTSNTVATTVNVAGPVVCSDITKRGECNNTPGCTWDKGTRTCVDAP
jgi:hypothetical protein